MKPYFLLATLLFLAAINHTYAQQIDFRWVEPSGGAGSEEAKAIAYDGEDHLYITGNFRGTATFGDTSFTAVEIMDAFIAKYDTSGTLLWIKHAGGPLEEVGSSIAVDDEGRVFVMGGYRDTITIGDTTLANPVGHMNLFIASFDSEGELLWAQRVESDNGVSVLDSAIDHEGNLVFTGNVDATADFNGISITSEDLEDAYIAKYTPQGTALWVERFDRLEFDSGEEIAIDHNNEILVLGKMREGTTIQETLVAKYSTDGELLWENRIRASERFDIFPEGVETDSEGNVIFMGNFMDTLVVGNQTLVAKDFDYSDLFLIKYDPDGSPIWAIQAGGDMDDGHYGDVVVDENDDITVLTTFNGTTQFGDSTLTSRGEDDFVLAKYSKNGTFQWAVQAGSSDYDVGRDLVTDGRGRYYIAGLFTETAQFGENLFFTSQGESDIFLAQVTDADQVATSISPEWPVNQEPTTLQNYPNPFRSSTTITYTLSQNQFIDITVYDILGRQIQSLHQGWKSAGTHTLLLDSKSMSAGIYLIRLATDKKILTRKVTLLP